MAPRFVNPHSLPEEGIVVLRTDIYEVDEDEGNERGIDESTRRSLIRELDDYLRAQLGPQATRDNTTAPSHDEGNRKRTRLEDIERDEEMHILDTIAFRLVSGSRAQVISLLPKPPPEINIRVREPACEDEPEEAEERNERARSSATEFEKILKESQLPMPLLMNTRKLHSVTLSKAPPPPSPPMLMLKIPQPFRATRPPVPKAQLSQWPYSRKPSMAIPSLITHSQSLPTFDVAPLPLETLKSTKNCRRRKARWKERTPPTFWRPEPSWKGKSTGYAMGY